MLFFLHGVISSAEGKIADTPRSHAQKYLSLIEKTANQQRKAKRQKRCKQVAQPVMEVFQPGMDFAADETICDVFEFHNADDQIDRDRIHPDPDKWPAPGVMVPDVDDVIE
jgi:hypothetical protein